MCKTFIKHLIHPYDHNMSAPMPSVGSDAREGGFPWMAMLTSAMYGRQFCGALLLRMVSGS